jgi:uncharacterized protein
MKIMMTGGTGFIGAHLASRFSRGGHEVTILTRSLSGSGGSSPGIRYLQGDPTLKGSWQEAVADHDILINLAGTSIFGKWTDSYKRAMRDSRINATRNLVEAIVHRPDRNVTLFSASAVGYYGFRGDEDLVEESPPGDDFLAGVALEWEAEALKAKEKGVRVVITRFGIVLGEGGGALGQMIPLFRKFLGGPIGSGRQWFSWIHIEDLAAAFVFLMGRPDISGPVNVCAPNPVRNRDFAKALGKALHRPSLSPAPGFMVRLILGEFGSVILEGQRMTPRRLMDNGFVFRYPDIDGALASLNLS